MSTEASLANAGLPGTVPAGTMTLAVSSSCNVTEPSPFDKIRARESARKKAQRSRKPTKGQNRQSAPRLELFEGKIPVSVPPEVHEYRKQNTANAKWLGKTRGDVAAAAACLTRIDGEPFTTTFEAISAASHHPDLIKRHKLRPVSPRQVERYMPGLKADRVLGYETVSEDVYRDGRWLRLNRIALTLNDDLLSEIAAAARAEQENERRLRAERRAEANRKYNAKRAARPVPDQAERQESGGVLGGGNLSNKTQVTGRSLTRTTKPSSQADDGVYGGLSKIKIKAETGIEPGNCLVPVPDPDSGVLDGVVVASVPGAAGLIDWDDEEVRKHLAVALGMDLSEIWSSAWPRLAKRGLGPEHAAAIDAAAQRSSGADTPMAAFWDQLSDCLPRAAEFRAEREEREAEERLAAEQAAQAAEQERFHSVAWEYGLKFTGIGMDSSRFRSQASAWRKECGSADEFAARLEAWLAVETAEYARQREQAIIENRITEFRREAALQRRLQEQRDKTMAEFVRICHGGDAEAAQRELEECSDDPEKRCWHAEQAVRWFKRIDSTVNSPWGQSILAYIRENPRCTDKAVCVATGYPTALVVATVLEMINAGLVQRVTPVHYAATEN